MLIFTLVFLLALTIFSLITEKKITVLFLFNVVWFFVVLLCSLNIFGRLPFSERVYQFVILGNLFFNIGYIMSSHIKFSDKEYRKKSLHLNNNIIIFLLTFSILFYFIQAIKVWKLYRSGLSLTHIRYSYYTKGKIMNNFESIISSWITTPIAYYLIIPINMFNFYKKEEKRKIVLVLSIIVVILYLFVSQAKQNIVYYIFSFIVALYQVKFDKKTRKLIIKYVVLIFIAILILNAVRHGEFSFSFLYGYAGISLNLLSYWSKYIDKIGLKTNGLAFLWGIINIPISFIQLVVPKLFSKINYIESTMSYMITTGIQAFKGERPSNNVFVTYLLFFYLDARFLGICVFSLIYGFVVSKLIKMCMKNQDKSYYMVMYNIIGVGVLYTFISWPIFNTAYVMSFIILRMICIHFLRSDNKEKVELQDSRNEL